MIFADSSFWIALRIPGDRHHEAARSALRVAGSNRLVVSNQVLGESWTFFRRKMGHAAAVSFLNRVHDSARVDLVRVSRDLEEQALSWLRKHDERAYSFVDATSFALMRSKKIREALAFDGDFTAAGFVELRA